ncbi:TPA: M protein [Streptococcus pyogenes]|nr:M protein [Streptococcus pyogenes]QCK32847.1 M protein [Streptococcus pyogenes]VGQ88028.1 M protein [Streptococcus pyogenes]VGQ93019.1 M protein [Streptococcus pyogenes]VGQ99797.1 M protein [Streptococcus pyogenes]VGR11114.1 M protein [Streptococcus pyogenes]
MAKNTTNRHYSLRKLKTGTASVAVALTVLGTGLVAGQTVKANQTEPSQTNNRLYQERQRLQDLKSKFQDLKNRSEGYIQQYYDEEKNSGSNSNWYATYLKELNDEFEQAYNELSGDGVKKLAASLMEERVALRDEIDQIKKISEELKNKLRAKEEELKNKKEERELEHAAYAADAKKHEEYVKSMSLVLMDKEEERHKLEQSLDTAKAELVKKEQELQLVKGNLDQKEKELENEELAKESAISDLTEQITAKKAEVEKLTQDLAAKSAEIQEKEAEKDRQQHMYEAFMSQYKEKVEKQEQELAKLKQLETINNNLLGNAKDMIAKLSAENEQLASDKAKLEEQNKISEASRKGLRRDLDASREAKKQVEKDLANLTAELDKVKEDKQISDASRKGLRRDLDASREAKKQVEKSLEEANSKLAALEKLNKELEESKKLTEKEKAELQAKLEAEAKALKEQLAKQAEELAKLRAGKASDSQTPDAKPGNKVVPGTGQAPQAGTKPNQNKAPMKETKRQLPSTGEAANPFFTAAALTVMATAGVAAVVKRKEEN